MDALYTSRIQSQMMTTKKRWKNYSFVDSNSAVNNFLMCINKRFFTYLQVSAFFFRFSFSLMLHFIAQNSLLGLQTFKIWID
jgi:hypothetical protein